MEAFLSAIVGELISRSISFAVDRFCHRRRDGGIEADTPKRLRRVLRRVQAVVEEADRRWVTNQAMLRQLHLMRDSVYRGYYLLSAIKCNGVLQENAQDPEVSRRDPSSFALSQFNPAKRLCTLSARTRAAMTNTTPDDTRRYGEEAEAELQEVLGVLERMASDMKELVVFLSCYPPLTMREPYSGHLWLANRMFGREVEQERIISFLLEPEPPGTEGLGVLPVIGRARVGKSTLVEHVCLDERVRRHFSLIVFFLGEGDIKDGEQQSPHLGDKAIVKHRDLDSPGKSLVVIELDGDVDENTWWRRTLSTLTSGQSTTPVSKIIVTSRSDKIASFGTTQALELKLLPREAYWYFFKMVVFGSTDAEDQPDLASVLVEMADLFNRSFIAANLFGGLLRANPCSQFWQRVLKGVKHYISTHLLRFGEHPSDLLAKGRPIYLWTLPKTDTVVIAFHYYQASSAQEHDLPKITMREVHTGSAKPRGKFEVVAWRSHIPPYYTYLFSCGVQKSSSLLRVPPKHKQIRQRQTRLRLSSV